MAGLASLGRRPCAVLPTCRGGGAAAERAGMMDPAWLLAVAGALARDRDRASVPATASSSRRSRCSSSREPQPEGKRPPAAARQGREEEGGSKVSRRVPLDIQFSARSCLRVARAGSKTKRQDRESSGRLSLNSRKRQGNGLGCSCVAQQRAKENC